MMTPKYTSLNQFSLLKPTSQTGMASWLAIMSKIKIVISILPKPPPTIQPYLPVLKVKAALKSFFIVSSTSTPKSNLSPSASDSNS